MNNVNIKNYKINADRDYVWNPENRPLLNKLKRVKWEPIPGESLETNLPIPWPDRYVKEFNQLFNPWTFFKNASVLCSYYQENPNEDLKHIISRLVDRCFRFSEVHKGLRFPIYNFDYEWRGVPIPAPWTSAYASGAVLLGLMNVFGCFKDEQCLLIAKELVVGLARPVDPGIFMGLWNSFIDDEGYLWFEEMPFPCRSRQPRILNGHIRAITGIYYYWTYVGDEISFKLLCAGITTVEKYAMQYRLPGGVNRYDLLSPIKVDYGPKRTVDQQDILYRMTGDPIFAQYRDVFRKDMRGML